MRNIFIEELILARKKNKNIFLVVNDLGYNVIEGFKNKFPKNVINAGVSEQSMMGYAAGLAASGKQVFVYSIGNFNTFRCAEQIRNDVDYHNLSVTVVSVGGGVGYGHLGYSHHAIQDYSLMRSFPNTLIAAPGDDYECRACIRYLIQNPQPSYLRLSKNLNYVVHKKIPKISPGKAIKIVDGKNKNAIYLTTGFVIDHVKKNYYKKKKYPIYSMPMWSMKVKKKQNLFIKKFKKVIVVEDHLQDGGFQSWILESLKNNNKTHIISRSFNSKIIGKVGSENFLMKFLGK